MRPIIYILITVILFTFVVLVWQWQWQWQSQSPRTDKNVQFSNDLLILDDTPRRTQYGTLIPIVAHIFEGKEWNNMADQWTSAGWSVQRWPSSHKPRDIVFTHGGLFTMFPPTHTHSLKNYIIYNAFNVTALLFSDTDQVFAAQSHHPWDDNHGIRILANSKIFTT